MIVSAPNPGFPFAGEPRISGLQSFPSGDPLTAGPEGGPRDLEKSGFERVFEEYLAAENRREEREAPPDREPGGGEAPPAAGGPAESEAPPGAEVLREAPPPAEAPREALLPGRGPGSPVPASGAAEIPPRLAQGKKAGLSPKEDGEYSPPETPETLSPPEPVDLPGSVPRSEAEAAGAGGLSPAPAGQDAAPPVFGGPASPAKKGPEIKSGDREEESSFAAPAPESAALREAEALPAEAPESPDRGEIPQDTPDSGVLSAVNGLRAGLAGGPGFSPAADDPGAAEIEPAKETFPEGDRVRENRLRRKLDLRDYREKPAADLPPAPEAPSLPRDSIPVDLSPGEGGGNFEGVLARELRQNLNGDIVRHAQLILRDKGEGIIRLSLRPESLGNVKIRLELTENKIAGRIIVESGEALRAFEREIASLEQAFRDSGYESAELSAFLSQDGSAGGREEGKAFYSPRFAMDRARYDEILERTDASFSVLAENGLGPGNGHIQVNMLI